MRHTNHIVSGLAVIACLGLLPGCDEGTDGNSLQKVNGSVHVHAGTAPSDAETVNGNIEIDDSATVEGVMTVNGGIEVGSHATAANLHTVNGGIVVGKATHIAKNIESVNGSISLADEVVVAGSVTNVNGKISLDSAQLGAGITTVNGDIIIRGASHVAGGIHVEKPGGVIQLGSNLPRIEIGPGATVQGELKFDREVRLYVSDKATVGPVTGATAIPFTGDVAPQD